MREWRGLEATSVPGERYWSEWCLSSDAEGLAILRGVAGMEALERMNLRV